ncbi:DUF1638 domain-containing protein [Ilumatobacter nonamiensis]|uniref:DUF1638 domain-containing protein n=1 Tax=Ilumatobacter nonamiensis TaxID=467093 RepID=UPI00034C0C83|nr:DUF1638 domain-containing protein [Ilumatobacter nonamiensis]
MTTSRTLVIACGALARELLEIVRLNGLDDVTVECLPAALHNRPSEIPDAVRARIHRARAHESVSLPEPADSIDPVDDARVLGETAATYDSIFVAYADCGTGGLLQQVCAEEGVEMLDGAHCYQFFATSPRFAEIQDAEIGSFYLTDFLVRHFDRMVWQGLGLDRHPELLADYFGNYTRLVYLAQTDDPALLRSAEIAADRLGLTMIVERTGYGELEPAMVQLKRHR